MDPRVKTEQKTLSKSSGYFTDPPDLEDVIPGQLVFGTHSTLLESTNHPIVDGKRFGLSPFYTVECSYDPCLGDPQVASSGKVWRNSISRFFRSSTWGVPFYDDLDTPFDLPTFKDFWAPKLTVWGSEGFAKARPGKPLAQLGQFLAELAELPALPLSLFRRLRTFQSLGSEYLNVEFGWKPFIKDLKKAVMLTSVIDQRLERLIKDEGLWIHRRAIVQRGDISSSTVASGTLNIPWGDLSDVSRGGSAYFTRPLYSGGPFGPKEFRGSGSVDYIVRENIGTRVWFEGDYRYVLPGLRDDPITRAKAIACLYGLDPTTPDFIWSVFPWSWFIDWFSNVGTVLSNISSNAVGNEAVDNGFVMATDYKQVVVQADVTWDAWETVLPGTESLFYTELVVSKLRDVASPFGMGLKWESFTPSQLGILAALGISRQRYL